MRTNTGRPPLCSAAALIMAAAWTLFGEAKPALPRIAVGTTLQIAPMQAGSATCAGFPAAFLPFATIYYVTPPLANGDRLVVGSLPMPGGPQAIGNNLALPSSAGQRYCMPVQLSQSNVFTNVYVPTAQERNGDFSHFAASLLDPFNNYSPLPGNLIPASRLGQLYAWKVGDQTNCTYTLTSPTPLPMHPAGGGGSVVVSTGIGCSWAASTTTSWLTITSSATGIGNGAATFSASANTGPARTGTIFLEGQSFAVAQAAAGAASGMRFVPLTPCRVMDTRLAPGPLGAPSMPGGSTRTVPVLSSTCAVSPSAKAYALNVTVVPAGPLSYLTVWPTGKVRPLASTLNAFEGMVVANNAIVPAGDAGSVDLFVTHATDAVVDITGYFTDQPSPAALAFYPLTPCRVADTRVGQGRVGPFGPPVLAGGSTRTLPLAGSCGIPSRAEAFAVNITVVPSVPLGFLTSWPSGQTRPLVSTLNSPDGRVVSNGAIVRAGTSGSIDVFVTHTADLIVDVTGYFAPDDGAGLLFFPTTPCRAMDTRPGEGLTGEFGPPAINGGTTRTVALPNSRCGIPPGGRAYSMNLTVVPTEPLAFVTGWPAGLGRPLVSTLNSFDGRIVANGMVTAAGSVGAIHVFASNSTHAILDLNGFFAK